MFFTLNRPFCPSTPSSTSVRADSSIHKLCGHKTTLTLTLTLALALAVTLTLTLTLCFLSFLYFIECACRESCIQYNDMALHCPLLVLTAYQGM